jgi:hypothetical protein
MLIFSTKDEWLVGLSSLEIPYSRLKVNRNAWDVLYFVPQKGMKQLVGHVSVGNRIIAQWLSICFERKRSWVRVPLIHS